MENFRRGFTFTSLIILVGLGGFLGGYWFRDRENPGAGDWPVLIQAYEILIEHGLKSAPADPALEYGMIRGMLQAYDDPYTSFVEPAQHELESDTLQGSFGGVGVRLSRDQDGNLILFPIPDGPADEAGVQEGDRLIRVEDMEITSATGMDLIQAALRGPVGQRVHIMVMRPPGLETLEFNLRRSEIPLPSVTWHLDPDEPRLGVIEINVIAASTPDEIENAVEDLNSRGATVYVLDLRDNFGGLLTAGVDTARLFLRSGTIIEQQYRDQDVETFKVERNGPLADLPLAILVNQHTASAAEIIAGALQAQQRATLIGAPTFGKSTIQLVFNLKDGSSLHVTSARWWVPDLAIDHNQVQIVPDIQLDPPTEENAGDIAIATAAAYLLDGEGK
jgi:carboxyl-terminal processing protease